MIACRSCSTFKAFCLPVSSRFVAVYYKTNKKHLLPTCALTRQEVDVVRKACKHASHPQLQAQVYNYTTTQIIKHTHAKLIHIHTYTHDFCQTALPLAVPAVTAISSLTRGRLLLASPSSQSFSSQKEHRLRYVCRCSRRID